MRDSTEKYVKKKKEKTKDFRIFTSCVLCVYSLVISVGNYELESVSAC